MSTHCRTCLGAGEVWTDTPDSSPPFGWSERKKVCDSCHGTGERDVMMNDFDGHLVRIVASGLIGECGVYEGIAYIIANGQEIAVQNCEEIELCEC